MGNQNSVGTHASPVRRTASIRKKSRNNNNNDGLALASSKSVENMGTKEQLNLKSCQLCQKIAVPPFRECNNGHLVCCGEWRTIENWTAETADVECHICKSPSRIIPPEIPPKSRPRGGSGSQLQKLFCIYTPDGCNVFASTLDILREHQGRCKYRPTKCHLSGIDDCSGLYLNASDYIPHLINVHKQCVIPSVGNKSNVFVTSYNIPCNVSQEEMDVSYVWAGNLFHFDGEIFVDLVRNSGAYLYFGFFLVNGTSTNGSSSSSDASKYNIQITLQKTMANGIIKNEVITPFPSIQDFQDGSGSMNYKLPYASIIHKDFVESVGEIVEETSMLQWKVQYEIKKLWNF